MNRTRLYSPLRFAVVTATLACALASHGQSRFSALHSFDDNPAKLPVAGLVTDSANNLYGVTYSSSPDGCGNSGCGVVFRLARKTAEFSIVHRFKGPDGESPWGKLIFDSSSESLFGTTVNGGAHGFGVVFQINHTGKEEVLYSFGATSNDLQGPFAGVILDQDRNLYGVATAGGSSGHGGVFELKRTSTGWQETILYNFSGGADGNSPYSTLAMDASENLYGTTVLGGQFGQGVVFELTRSGTMWSETVLHNLGNADGNSAIGSLIFDGEGSLFGTTRFGGAEGCDANLGCGTVFELTPSRGSWTFKVVHTFDWDDGATPTGLAVDSVGNVYGTASLGGDVAGDGLVFELSQVGGNWTETVLHTFSGNDGSSPQGDLLRDQNGTLYGVATNGGICCGVVFLAGP